MNSISNSKSPSDSSGVSFEMKTIRCHSVVNGVVAFCSGCRQNPVVTKQLHRGSGGAWNYIYTPAVSAAGSYGRRSGRSQGSGGGGTTGSLVGDSLSATTSQQSSSASPTSSSSAYRITSSTGSSGSQSSSLQSSSTDDRSHHGCGCCCFRPEGEDNVADVVLRGARIVSSKSKFHASSDKCTDDGAAAMTSCGDGSRARCIRAGATTGQTFASLMLTYLERTSAHALPRVARSRSRVRRVLWIGTFVFFVGYFAYQFAALLDMFYSYPVGATIFIDQRSVDT